VTVPSAPTHTKRAILLTIAKFFDPLDGLLPLVLPPKFPCNDCGPSNAGGMTKFLANFLIADPITINDFRVSMPLAFRARLFTDFTLYTTPFIGAQCRVLFFPTATFAAVVYLHTINIGSSIIVSLLAAKSKVAPLKTISPAIEIICCVASRSLDAFRALSAPTSESRVSLLESRVSLHHYTRLTESESFSMESLCRQLRFGCTITSEVSCSDAHQSRRLRVSLPIFSRHMLYSGQTFHGCIILPSPGRTQHALRCLPICSIGISHRIILCDQNCYELPLIYISISKSTSML